MMTEVHFRNSDTAESRFYYHAMLSLAFILYRNVEIKDRKCLFKTYKSCFIGSELVDYLLNNHFCSKRYEAVALGNILCEQGIIYHVLDKQTTFKDQTMYYSFKDPSNIFESIQRKI
eukprot:195057_1